MKFPLECIVFFLSYSVWLQVTKRNGVLDRSTQPKGYYICRKVGMIIVDLYSKLQFIPIISREGDLGSRVDFWGVRKL